MYVCWKCGREYDDDSIEYCADCGAINAPHTPTLEKDRIKKSDLEKAAHARIRGIGSRQKHLVLELDIRGEKMALTFERRIIFGRDFDPSPGAPVINLTLFGAIQAGVSRRHAALQRTHDNHVTLMDMGSTNGTFLNSEQLKPLKDYPLTDGDVIYLGNLVVVLHLESD